MNATNGGTQRARPGSIVLGAALMLAVGVTAYLLGAVHARNEPALVPQQAVDAPVHSVDDIAAMRSDLRDLREQFLSAAPRPDLRTPAVPGSEGDAKLIAAIERLEAAISRLDHGTGGGVSTHPYGTELVGLGQELDQLDIVPRSDDAVQPFWDWAEKRVPDLSSKYLLWSVDQVISACGRPARVETSGDQIYLEYDVGRERDGHVGEVHFITTSLRVVQVELNWR
jgi:hypothetical protein